jgi:hypothetical protein
MSFLSSIAFRALLGSAPQLTRQRLKNHNGMQPFSLMPKAVASSLVHGPI